MGGGLRGSSGGCSCAGVQVVAAAPEDQGRERMAELVRLFDPAARLAGAGRIVWTRSGGSIPHGPRY